MSDIHDARNEKASAFMTAFFGITLAAGRRPKSAGIDAARLRAAFDVMRPKPSPYQLLRIGGDEDGSYLLPDDIEGIEACFSPGVNNSKTFEDCLADQHEIPSHMCDKSSDPEEFRTPLKQGMQTFIQKWLDTDGGEDSVTLKDWIETNCPGSGDLLLQIDIEGAEYRNLLATPPDVLRRFRIIVIELHGLNRLIHPAAFDTVFEPFLTKLDRDFICVHAHPNNCRGEITIPAIGVILPRVFELTFLRRDRFGAAGAGALIAPVLPHPLDIGRNCRRKPPLFLNEAWFDGPRPETARQKMLDEQLAYDRYAKEIALEREVSLMNDTPPLFIANRRDGFGERLRAILNAKALADHFGGRFGFHWTPAIPEHEHVGHHSIASVADTFSAEFVATHHIDQTRLEAMQIVSLPEAMVFSAGHDGVLPPDADAIQVEQRDVMAQGVSFPPDRDRAALLRHAWKDLPFAKPLEEARYKALALSLPASTVAIHLRGGDKIYGSWRMTDLFRKKVCPYPVAEEIIRRKIAQGITPIVFGQDVDLCRYLRDRHGALLAHDLTHDFAFDGNQQAMFDIVLMSRCQEIVAGNSGFAILASWIGGVKRVDPQQLFSAQEMVELIEQAIFSSDPAKGVSPLQRAFACRYALVESGQNFPTKPRFQRLMDHARAMDPENHFYHLVQAVASYAAGEPQKGKALIQATFNQISETRTKAHEAKIKAHYAKIKQLADTRHARDVAALSEKLRTAEARIAALQGSTSWRVTAPLRRIVLALRRQG